MENEAALIEGWLSKEGALARLMKGFRPRAEQLAMAQAISRSLAAKTHLVVEAGTGIGKSLAYLLPSALWAARNGKRVVIATHTKALQEQLIHKDLPVLQRLFEDQGLDLKYALLMGSENYLCMQRLEHCLRSQDDFFGGTQNEPMLRRLSDFSRSAGSGLRTRLPFSVPDELWEAVNRDPDVCLGRRGSAWEACLYRKDTAAARGAHVLVVNQHLLFAGLADWLAFDALVIDEAHNLEEVAAQFLGFSLTSSRIKRLLDDTLNLKTRRGLAARLKQAPESWREELARQIAEAHRESAAFFDSLRSALRLVQDFELGAESKAKRVVAPNVVSDELGGRLGRIARSLSEVLIKSASKEEEREVQAMRGRYLTAVLQLRAFLDCDRKDFAYWGELRMHRKTPITELNMAPLQVAEALKEMYFQKPFTVVLASATLAVGGSFKNFKKGVGLDQGEELLLSSPFDYPVQSGLFIPSDVPDPASDKAGYEAAVARYCRELAAVVPGGVFILFSSWALLRATHDALRAVLPGRPVFKQGDAPAYELLRRYREAGNGVLFGTDTFWQGVDIAGPALACVILTRLPFASPGSPLEDARKEWLAAQGIGMFGEYALPKAVLKFRQGFGRLIRSTSDYGVVAVLDPRIKTKKYGGTFLRSIPKSAQLRSVAEVQEFFRSRQRPAADSAP